MKETKVIDKDVETRLVTKECDWPLSNDQIIEKGTKAGQLSAEIGKIELEFDTVKKSFKDRIGAKEQELNLILTSLNKRTERKKGEVKQVKNFKSKTVEFLDPKTDKVLESRPLQPQEMQGELPFDKKAVPLVNPVRPLATSKKAEKPLTGTVRSIHTAKTSAQERLKSELAKAGKGKSPQA
jgi:hypothetical protein